MKPVIIVTRRWPSEVETRLGELDADVQFNRSDRPFSRETLRDALVHADVLLPTVSDDLGPQTFVDLKPRTRLIANYGVGVSHIDLEAVRAADILVTNTPDVLTECTADLTMGMIIACARRMSAGERELRGGHWTGWRPTHLLGTRVSGAVLGIVGMGRIGRAVARRAQQGFGMDIRFVHPRPLDPQHLDEFNATQDPDLSTLCEEVDFLSLHCPGGAANRHLVNAQILNALPARAFLVNTSRGEVVDAEALADALEQGQIAGAALDVYEDEPKVPGRLLRAPNLTLLPHLGSATQATRTAMGLRVLENVQAYLAGKEPRDVV